MPPALSCCDPQSHPKPWEHIFKQLHEIFWKSCFLPSLAILLWCHWVMCSMLFLLLCLCPWHNPCLAIPEPGCSWSGSKRVSTWLPSGFPGCGSLALQGVIGFPSASASLSLSPHQIQEK